MQRVPYCILRAAAGYHHGRGCDIARLAKRVAHGLARRESTRPELLPSSTPASSQSSKVPELDGRDLSHEADMNADEKGGRLVDLEAFKHNALLWAQLLRHRSGTHGEEGVKQIFHGMRDRKVNIPAAGPVSEEIWSKLGNCISRDTLFRYAMEIHRRTGSSWPGLYTLFLKPLLATSREETLHWAKRMRALGLHGAHMLHTLIPVGLRSKPAMNNLKALHRLDQDAKIYRKMISALCEKKMLTEALLWHRRMVLQKDLPNSTSAAEPLVELLRSDGHEDADFVTRDLKDAGVPWSKSGEEIPSGDEPTAIDEYAPDPIMQAMGPTPKTISDKFAARAFATRMWSLDTIINGLTYFGLTDLGPLAVRELAARCASVDELAQRFDEIDSKGVTTVDCVFTKLVRRLVSDGDQRMLEAVVGSDMHPDVYEDAATQEQLLRYYQSQKDEVLAQRTLMILSIHERRDMTNSEGASSQANEDGADALAWNKALEEYIREERWESVELAVNQMMRLQIGVHPFVIRASWHVFEKRSRHLKYGLDDAQFVTKLWLKIMRSGFWIEPFFWHRPIDCLGRQGRLEEMERVCLWITDWYSKRSRTRAVQQQRLRAIFTAVRVKRMIIWGFQSLSTPDLASTKRSASMLTTGNDPHRWLLGVRIARVLRQYGVRVPTSMVRSVCLQRLKQLFDKKASPERRNQIARERNPHSLVEMVEAINEAWRSELKWGDPPFDLPAEVLQDEEVLRQRLIFGEEADVGE